MTDVPQKKGTESRDPCDYWGRDWSNATASQKIPRTESQPQDARMRQGKIFPYRLQREHGPATPSFHTSSLQNHKTINCCCLRHPVCGMLWQKPWDPNIEIFPRICLFLKRKFLAFKILKRIWSTRNFQSKCSLYSPQVIPFTRVTLTWT